MRILKFIFSEAVICGLAGAMLCLAALALLCH